MNTKPNPFEQDIVGQIQEPKKNDISLKSARGMGVGLIVIATIMYLIEGIRDFNPFNNLVVISAIQIIFTFLGFKQAASKKTTNTTTRTFFGLASGMIPVLFTSCGAMLFSLLGTTDGFMGQAFQSISWIQFAIAMMLTLIVAIPVNQITSKAFSVGLPISPNYILPALSIPLMLPFRGFLPTVVILGIQLIILVPFLKKLHQEAATSERTILESLFYIPVLIGVGRAVFYTTDSLASTLVFALCGFLFSFAYRNQEKLKRVVQHLSWIGMLVAFAPMIDILKLKDLHVFVVFLNAVILSTVLFQANKVVQSLVQFLVIMLLAGSLLVVNLSTPINIILVTTPIISMLAAAVLKRDKVFFVGACLGAVIISSRGLYSTMFFWKEHYWMAFGLLGVVLLLGTSAWERKDEILSRFNTKNGNR